MKSRTREKDVESQSPSELRGINDIFPLISGSFARAFIVDSFVAYTSRSGIGSLNPVVTSMQLNQTLKGLLGASPVVSTMLTQIPMTHYIEKNGGKKATLVMIACTLTGMVTLTVLSSLTDITSVTTFDWRYATMLGAGYLIGCGGGTFPLLIDSLKWARKTEHFSMIQSGYSAIVDSSSVTTPAVIYFLQRYGYATPFGLYVGLIAIGGLVALKFLQAPPYDQLKKDYSPAEAKQLAMNAGQLEIMIKEEHHHALRDILKENLMVLFDRRGLTLNFTFFATLGSFFVTETIFPSLLTQGYGASEEEAIITSSVANIITIATRLFAGKAIARWERESGGIHTHLLGCGIIAASCIPLALIDMPRWGLYASIASMNVGFGMTIVTPLNIAHAWSKPTNETLSKYNVGTLFGLLGTLGTLGGIVLPLVLGGFVEGDPEQGYQHYFLLIMAMMLTSAIAVPVVNNTVTHSSDKSIYSGVTTLFSRMRNRISSLSYLFSESDQPAIEKSDQPRQHLENSL